MIGLWLASYIVLWGLVVVVCLLLLGILQQIGLIHRQLKSRPTQPQEENSIPALEHDGPAIGRPLMNQEVGTLNGFGTLTLAPQRDGENMLLVFMSPLCDTCQHIVEPLNALIEDAAYTLHSVVIMRGDEPTCQAFLSVFPLRMPVVCDRDRSITMGLDIHRTPFGLLYNEHGSLIRKGFLGGDADIQALLGDGSVPATAQANIFPRLVSSQL